jgi:hypothetical protein
MLIEHGVDPKSAGPVGLALALRVGCSRCVELLSPVSPPPVLSIAAQLVGPPLAPAEDMPLLLSRGADPNANEVTGYTLLISAAASDHIMTDLVKMLIEKGADINAKGPRG